ncbi:MAG: hypothetical protein CMF41_06035 [Legionellales bacterium]|nr:hypothetical protein [Legionellales bacterium]OUX64272.1 MAG: hypothetical protein CBE41_03650 [Gammaproteobacteria bacterium TMED281]
MYVLIYYTIAYRGLNVDLERQLFEGKFVLQGYEPGKIIVNKKTFNFPIIISPTSIHDFWKLKKINTLVIDDFDVLIKMSPELIIIGTGPKHVVLDEKLFENCYEKNIPVECMASDKACLVLPTLLSEKRKVVAALFV